VDRYQPVLVAVADEDADPTLQDHEQVAESVTLSEQDVAVMRAASHAALLECFDLLLAEARKGVVDVG
jgi:hypothetical protein